MNQELKKVLESLLSKTSVLYHYCSVPAFFSIVKNKSIWLSDVSKSNDSQELRWFLTEYEKLLHSLWYSLLLERKKAGFEDDPIETQELYSSLSQELYSDCVKCWAFCLSEKRDDLGQWRGYADNGKGIAIGFKREPFNAIVNEEILRLEKVNDESVLSPRFDYVRYGKIPLSHFVENFRKKLKLSVDLSPTMLRRILSSSITGAYKISPFYKNEGFSAEAEWRIIYSQEYDSITYDGVLETDHDVKVDTTNIFRPTNWGYIEKNSDLVSHIEFVNEDFSNSIAEIIIGPKCKLTEDEVKLFMVSCGLFSNINSCSVNVYKSESSYR